MLPLRSTAVSNSSGRSDSALSSDMGPGNALVFGPFANANRNLTLHVERRSRQTKVDNVNMLRVHYTEKRNPELHEKMRKGVGLVGWEGGACWFWRLTLFAGCLVDGCLTGISKQATHTNTHDE